MTEIHCPDGVLYLIARLEAAGHEAYTVGGCVRDALLNTSPHDWDITTSAAPEEVKAALPDLQSIDTGIKHGTVTILLDAPYEITTFRVDGPYTDGRHPDRVTFSKRLTDDLSRRDFTINAMAYHPSRGLIDVFGGADDLQAGIIRCVGSAEARIQEDALRAMRAVRFQSRLNFAIEPETQRAIENHIPRLANVSAERIGAEFQKTVTASYAARAIRENQLLFCAVLPPLRASIGFPQNNPYHYQDVFEHTLSALQAAGQKNTVFPPEWADDAVRLALLFHDLGKPACRTTDESGTDHFYGHAEESARLAEESMKALKFSNLQRTQISELIRLHDIAFPLRRPAVKRWLGRLPEDQLKRLLKVKECDISAHTPLAAPQLKTAEAFWALAQQVKEEHAALSLKDLSVNGRDLSAAGVPNGKIMGAILHALLNEVIEEQIVNEPSLLLNRALALQEEWKQEKKSNQ